MIFLQYKTQTDPESHGKDTFCPNWPDSKFFYFFPFKNSCLIIFLTIFFKKNFLSSARLASSIFSDIDFFLNKNQVQKEDCNSLKGAWGLFKSINQLTIAKVKFPKFLCPTIFDESGLQTVIIRDVSNSLINKNTINYQSNILITKIFTSLSE